MDLEHCIKSSVGRGSAVESTVTTAVATSPNQPAAGSATCDERVPRLVPSFVIGVSMIFASIGFASFESPRVSTYPVDTLSDSIAIAKGEGKAPADNAREQDDQPKKEVRELRWAFTFDPDQSVEDYARMLDFYKIELAMPEDKDSLNYASTFTGEPKTRTGRAVDEKRMYVIWSTPERKAFDIKLMNKAGIKADKTSLIIQLLPKKLEDDLAQAEYHFKKRQPGEIRKTTFKIAAAGDGFEIKVIDQQYLE